MHREGIDFSYTCEQAYIIDKKSLVINPPQQFRVTLGLDKVLVSIH